MPLSCPVRDGRISTRQLSRSETFVEIQSVVSFGGGVSSRVQRKYRESSVCYQLSCFVFLLGFVQSLVDVPLSSHFLFIWNPQLVLLSVCLHLKDVSQSCWLDEIKLPSSLRGLRCGPTQYATGSWCPSAPPAA